MSERTKPAVPTVARMLREIATPEGFEREVRTEPKTQWAPAVKVLVLKGDGIEIEIWFSGGRDSYSLASGHVTFETSAGRRTFDRYGVEDSFYIDNPAKMGGEGDVIQQANEAIRRFVEERVPEARAQLDRSERVPGIPFEVTPERKAAVTEALRGSGRYKFMPSGFGTGYTLTTKATRYGAPAPRELEQFFGLAPLYVEKFDAD